MPNNLSLIEQLNFQTEVLDVIKEMYQSDNFDYINLWFDYNELNKKPEWESNPFIHPRDDVFYAEMEEYKIDDKILFYNIRKCWDYWPKTNFLDIFIIRYHNLYSQEKYKYNLSLIRSPNPKPEFKDNRDEDLITIVCRYNVKNDPLYPEPFKDFAPFIKLHKNSYKRILFLDGIMMDKTYNDDPDINTLHYGEEAIGFTFPLSKLKEYIYKMDTYRMGDYCYTGSLLLNDIKTDNVIKDEYKNIPKYLVSETEFEPIFKKYLKKHKRHPMYTRVMNSISENEISQNEPNTNDNKTIDNQIIPNLNLNFIESTLSEEDKEKFNKRKENIINNINKLPLGRNIFTDETFNKLIDDVNKYNIFILKFIKEYPNLVRVCKINSNNEYILDIYYGAIINNNFDKLEILANYTLYENLISLNGILSNVIFIKDGTFRGKFIDNIKNNITSFLQTNNLMSIEKKVFEIILNKIK